MLRVLEAPDTKRWHLLTIINIIPFQDSRPEEFHRIVLDRTTWEPCALNLHQKSLDRALKRRTGIFATAIGARKFDETKNVF